MDILILTFAVLAILHLVYEGIIAPSIRLKLRYRLFSVRDELRRLKSKETKFSEKLFDATQGQINTGLRMLHRTDIEMLWRVHNALTEEEVMERVRAHERLLKDIENVNIAKLSDAIGRIARQAFETNCGAWNLYIIPIAVLWICFGEVTRLVRGLLQLPAGVLEAIAPREGRFAT